MNTYSKRKSFIVFISSLIFFGIPFIFILSGEGFFVLAVIWLSVVVAFILLYYKTFRIDITDKQMIVHTIWGSTQEVYFEEVNLIKFEGIILRDKFLIMTLYSSEHKLMQIEIYEFNSKAMISRIIRNASLNNYILEFTEVAEKMITSFKE